MTSSVTSTVNDKELFSCGLIESASVNSFADFISSKSNDKEVIVEHENNDFINNFICHLIFYSVLCFSLVLHIVIDLGLGSFVRKLFVRFMEIARHNVFEMNPAFA